MDPEADIVRYYAQRAQQYERVYHKPERQADLARLRALVSSAFAGKHVLELACGTGYWTELISASAASILALDINEEVLSLARAKPIPPGKVSFVQGDVYAFPSLPRRFDAAVAGFWWSHIPINRLAPFLHHLHNALEPGASVMFFDNCYVAGSSTPLSRKDSDGNPLSCRDDSGNTYQQRVLDDGSVHQVVKNFPTAEELRAAAAGLAADINIQFLTYYWIFNYSVVKTNA